MVKSHAKYLIRKERIELFLLSYPYNDVASLRVFMAALRKKLEKSPSTPQFIQTHIGVGYRMLRV